MVEPVNKTPKKQRKSFSASPALLSPKQSDFVSNTGAKTPKNTLLRPTVVQNFSNKSPKQSDFVSNTGAKTPKNTLLRPTVVQNFSNKSPKQTPNKSFKKQSLGSEHNTTEKSSGNYSVLNKSTINDESPNTKPKSILNFGNNQNGQQKTATPKNKKKKSKGKKISEDDKNTENIGSPAKRQKLQMFSGIVNLNDSNSKVSQVKSTPVKPEQNSQEKNNQNEFSVFNNPVKITLQETAKLNRRQKRRLLTKLKKKAIKAKFSQFTKNVKSGDVTAHLAVEEINSKITEIQKRPEMSNSSKRRLRDLKKMQKLIDSGGNSSNTKVEPIKKESDDSLTKTEKRRRRREKKLKEKVDNQNLENKVWADDAKKLNELNRPGTGKDMNKQNVKPSNLEKGSKPKVSVKSEKQSITTIDIKQEKSDLSISKKQTKNLPGKAGKQEPETPDSDYDVEKTVDVNKISKGMNEIDDDSKSGDNEESGAVSSDNDDDDNNVEENLEQIKNPVKAGNKKNKANKNFGQPNESNVKENGANNVDELLKKVQSRYVVFVGNIPYDAEKKDIIEHFQKVGEVKHIRIPTEKGTNKPRGFAYVEVKNEDAYQRALSLHHTSLKGRRINVLYTQGGKKKGSDKKNEIKTKNFKLQAMRKEGKLAGSVKETQKRSARRAKKRKLEEGKTE